MSSVEELCFRCMYMPDRKPRRVSRCCFVIHSSCGRASNGNSARRFVSLLHGGVRLSPAVWRVQSEEASIAGRTSLTRTRYLYRPGGRLRSGTVAGAKPSSAPHFYLKNFSADSSPNEGGKNGMWRIFHLLGNANNVAVTVTGREWKISIGCHAQGRLQGPIKGLVA
ncbi:hypothetical protein CDAR_496021 [Caerostris darwini]|uniref:Uncharacterized protein n=1 Tax=Caerostris darwini TaxID=1538125 RepID=A0AAV4U1N7_9ARAC|nr:hypothetical protein CDAR_496021 [Caerostris darwini]